MSDVATLAGYFSYFPVLGSHPDVPNMDLSASDWVIRFTLDITRGEDIADADPLAAGERNRGAFSLITIVSDMRGVELVFQPDRVFVLDDANTAFRIGEVASINTTGELRSYDLLLQDEGYELFVSDSSRTRQSILSGSLRDYRPVAPDLASFVYSTPNFIFFGDDSARGAGDVRIGYVQAVAVPEPTISWISVLVVGIAGIRKYQRLATVSLCAK